LEDIDKLRETIARVESKAIVEYIRKHENTNMDGVVEELKKQHIASRLTTLSVLDKLIQLEIIIDDRKGKYSHSLRYNENYNWLNLVMTIMTDYFEDVKNAIYGLSKDQQVQQLLVTYENFPYEMVVKAEPTTKRSAYSVTKTHENKGNSKQIQRKRELNDMRSA